MKNLASLSIVLCLFSCSPELELVDWIDRAEEACQCENLTKGTCLYVDVKFTIREGKIESVLPPWISGRDDLYEQTEEWFEGPCSDTYRCFTDHLIGKKVTEKSGTYDQTIEILWE